MTRVSGLLNPLPSEHSISTTIMIWTWALLATVAAGANVNDLVGTWTTKSREVLTGSVC